MNDITTTIELQEAIKQLEADYIVEERALKAQLHTTYEAIQPLNFIKSTLKQVAGSDETKTADVILGITEALTHHPNEVKQVGKQFFSLLKFGINKINTLHDINCEYNY